MAWSLQGPLDGSDRSRLVALRLRTEVGRDPAADLSIDNASVSGAHARLEVARGELWVTDLSSRNGTYVNGEPVTAPTRVRAGDLLQFANVVFRVIQRDRAQRAGTMQVTSENVVKPLLSFERLLATRDVVPFFQPVVDTGSGEHVAYELLGRSRVPGLENPGALFRAAAALQREVELSELFREVGAAAARELGSSHVFMNSHPRENDDWEHLADTMIALREAHPDLRLTLEIHEATVSDHAVMTQLQAALRDAGIGLAYDDFGAGQARLRELLDIPPDVLKFDIGLIRGLDTGPPARLRMVRTLVEMVRELGIAVLAEGVETPGEAEACSEAGFEYVQGFHFGRPAPAETWGRS